MSPETNRGHVLPLGLAQRRLWFLSRLGVQASEAYVISVGLQLRGALDTSALRLALDGVYRRHDVLRARIVETDGEPHLVPDVRNDAVFTLTTIDLRDAGGAADGAVDAQAQREFSAPFDLHNGPLIRACLIALAPDRHVLLINVHHVIFDGTSLQLLLREIDANYRLATSGQALGATPAPRYTDCIALQNSHAYAERLRLQKTFWHDSMSGAPLMSTLPCDAARAAQHDFAGAFVHWRIDAVLTARLRALAKRHDVSLFSVLLAAWACLIQRLSLQEEAVVGVSTSGRTADESRDVIGCFVGTIPVRIGNPEGTSVAGAITLAAAQLRAAAAHQDLPFDRIVDTAGVQRNLAHNPLFQTLLNWYGAAHGEIAFGDLDVTPLPALERKFGLEGQVATIERATPLMLYGGTVERVVAKLDLSLLIWESAGELIIGLEYAAALFDTGTVRRYLALWQRLLEGFADDDTSDVHDIALMSAGERERIVRAWNGECIAHGDATVIELMQQHVRATPDAPALEHADTVLTYAQLDAQVAALAQRLSSNGIGAGDRVAVALERGIAMVVALLGVLRCGAAYVPLDLQHPPSRRQHVLSDAGVAAVLVQGNASAVGVGIVTIDVDAAAPPGDVGTAPPPHASQPQDLAYVIYTSGTTGVPKGVMIEHASLANLLLAMRSRLDIQPQDRVLALTTLSFDISALEIFLPLVSGACIVMADRATAQDPYALTRLMTARAISVVQATPTTWRMLIDSGWSGLPRLRALSGGEPLPVELAERVAARVHTLWNVYGPTETTIWSTVHRVEPAVLTGRLAIEPIGRPLDNTCVYVLDARRRPVPPGVTGTLYIAGAGVARGYVGLTELTQERFLPDPFTPGQRMYCSGDLARWDDDGVLHHLGRTDDQVKLHGHRIELTEIEAQLSAHPALAESAVVLKGTAGHRALVAYCVLGEGASPPPAGIEESLREHLLRFLPLYMVPDRYVVLPDLPVSPNGKIDRARLPEPTAVACVLREAPRAGIESDVAAIWSELFDGRLVDRHDNFFRIGGHSLLAVRAVARLRSASGVDVGVSELFAHPTLAAFAAAAARAEQALRPSLTRVARDGLLPLSFAQQRLWFVAQTGSDASRAYHMPLVLHLRGELDVVALQHTIEAIRTRHEALRTVFPEIDGQPGQHVLTLGMAPPLLVRELTDAGDAAVDTAVAAEVDRPFDLTVDVPLRAVLLRLGPSRHVLVLTVHHIACDGWSLALLQHELMTQYNAARRGTRAALPDLPVQYADYAVWQRRHLDHSALDAHARYWKERLAAAPALLELPADRPRPPQQDFRGDYVDCTFARSLTDSLRALAVRCETTLFVTVLAGWAALLSRLSGETDLVIGTPVANRDQLETEHLIGFFANTLPLRLDLDGNPTARGLVERCRDEMLAAQRHRELPFERLVELLRPARSAAHTPLFQIALAWQSVPPVAVTLDGLEQVSQQLLLSGKSAKFDLTMYLWETPEGLAGGIEYATALFERRTIERYLSHWQILLRAMVDDDSQLLRDLPLLGVGERDQLLQQWACGPQPVVDARPVHVRVASLAQAQPNAIAVQQRDQRISYGELDRRANQLAVALSQCGTGAGDRVGVCLQRSPTLIVALLAVLKSGAAYVLLDPALPAERLAHMLDDSAATVLVAHADVSPALLRPGRTRLDPDAVANAPSTPAGAIRSAGDVAYVIYTSGSTGMPKGIAIEHRGLNNLVHWLVAALDLAPGRLASGVCGLAFDASVIDIWPTLCAGGTLLLTPVEAAEDADALLHWWSAQPFHSSMLPTPLAELALAQGMVPASLRVLATGGARLTRHRPARAAFRLLNLYGPAEITVAATCDDVGEDGPITIGRPIPHLRAYVLDESLQPQPIGVVGELYLGGIGVAAGYLGLPELSAQRFLRDPYASDPVARLYRTGDLVRWLDDGRIDYVGRADDQIKMRGMRIELGEIESALAALPQVREAAVVPLGQAGDVTRLIAFVVLQPAEPAAIEDLSDQRVAEWTRLYDDNYRVPDAQVLFDFGGWNSSYTGESIALVEMEEWRQQTVARVLALQPRRVLEIGCGSGLLLLGIAPLCERYVGIDFSREALHHLQAKVDRQGIDGVELVHARADELDRLGAECFDTIIVNSVVQYFPSERYLSEVIEAALARLTPDGHLFIGDVRNLLLLDAFHASIHAFRRGSTPPRDELASLARASSRLEKELLIAPRFFRDLADTGRVADLQLLPKTGMYVNELTAYRYDVVLHRCAPASAASSRRFDAMHDSAALRHAFEFLDAQADGVAVVANLRNTLIEPSAYLIEPPPDTLTGVSTIVAEAVAAARQRGLQAEPSWLASDCLGRFHLLVARTADALRGHARVLRDLPEPPFAGRTNVPVDVLAQAQRGRELAVALGTRLPDYMVPSQFVFMPRLPLTANGKVDRAALPAPETLPGQRDFVAPATPSEQLLATIWCEVLGCPPPGINDHFFELGGHSLAAVQVLARIRRAVAIEVSPPDLFAHPVLSDFARFIDAAAPAEATALLRAARDAALPLSFEQEGLWFLAKLPGAAAAYNIVFGVRLRGTLVDAALDAALDALVQRHESLRTVFVDVDGRPQMRIVPHIACASRRHVPPGDASGALRDLIDGEIDRQFDLEAGPLFRVCVMREAHDSHALIFSLHHIVGDGWSMRVLLSDLAALYDAQVDPTVPAPRALPLQYADWVASQRHTAARHQQRYAAYWQTTLRGATPLLELASDRLRPTQQDFRGGFVPCHLDAGGADRLRAAARRFGTTPFVLLLTSWALLLWRLSGQDDVIVGTPSANRSTEEAQALVGMLVSTLPLRLDLSGTPHLSELIRRFERTSLEAQQHQDIAFEKIVELVSAARSLAYNPVFQVMFAWQAGSAQIPGLRGLRSEPLPDCAPHCAKFDLSLILAEAHDGIHGGIEYASALFDESTIVRYRAHWLTILEQIVAGSDMTIDRIEVLTPAQRHQVLEAWNDTRREFPHEQCIHTLFEQQAAATPDAIALQAGDEHLDYAELDSRAGRLARYLVAHGVRVGSFVAIHIERSTAMIIAVLATLKAGAAYVPLDTSHPAARKAHVLGDCQPGWLLHTGDVPSFDGLESPPRVIEVNAALAAAPILTSALPPPITSTELAYIIYTSGSTGLPKGVMLEHRSVVNRLAWMQRHFAIGPDDAVLQKTALGFDVSVWELFLPLICGSRLVLAEPDSHRDPQRLARIMRETGITILHFVPSMLHLFLAQRSAFDFPALKHVVCSGEELPPAVVEDFQRKLPRVGIQNLYGPTEASIDVSWHLCARDHGAVRIPIGRPIDNCRLYVLDREHRPLPSGVAGELYIGGVPVARGYFNRPDINSERFLPDPFADDARARMYKTGDKARWLQNGEIDFLGRNDAQIKLRGFRIELSEIESHLARFPGVAEAAAALRQDASGGPMLVAYWVGGDTGDVSIDAAALRSHLAAALPEYMIPTQFVRLEQLPLNANGKLDRNALPAFAADVVTASTGAAPAGMLEETIAAAWSVVLGRGNLGRDENFFAVGGHSLMTLRLVRQLQQVDVTIQVADVFRYPTIAALARAVQQRADAHADAALVAVRDADGTPLFLLHDGFGLLLYAHVLAAQLPVGIAVCGLAETASPQDESASIALLADRLLPALRERQPQGPYRLAGWSFGGLLAYEIATRLIDDGETVEYLGLIDSYYGFEEPGRDEHPAQFAETPPHVAALDPATRQICLARHEIYALAARRYAARPLHITVDLVKTSQCDVPPMREWRGWERVLPPAAIRVHDVDGCHFSMMTTPFIAGTAAALARGLVHSPQSNAKRN
ncbi:non-ribosomal peptide synthetase [Tahibacter sp.]|uniref:non-ribosomal peptide synthetase n=1 Tax=Tahibacter sp. TaxID=2056211 RepID=UPI0028C51021|nr:non-ribosomal peptide synthetase [Tahibacter sp.]